MGKLVIAGGSGFLGRGLIRHLTGRFGEVVVLTRSAGRLDGRVRFVQWDGRTPEEWCRILDGATALINLVGRTVDCRKTPANKQAILRSRVDSVNALIAATAHIFGDTKDEILDE